MMRRIGLAILIVLFAATSVYAGATRFPFPKFRAFGSSGTPLASGKVYTYETGASTTPKTTWKDATKASANDNPVILDSTGQADIWLDGSYRIVLKNAAGTTLWTVDNVNSLVEIGAYTVYPQAYGAVGNGVADDTVAVQAALNVGGVVEFPTGTYKITAELVFPTSKDLIIRGEGHSSLISCEQTDGSDCIQLNAADSDSRLRMIENIKILTTASAGHGININSSLAPVHLHNVYVRGASAANKAGIYIKTTHLGSMERVFVSHCYNGIYFEGANAWTLTAPWVVNNTNIQVIIDSTSYDNVFMGGEVGRSDILEDSFGFQIAGDNNLILNVFVENFDEEKAIYLTSTAQGNKIWPWIDGSLGTRDDGFGNSIVLRNEDSVIRQGKALQSGSYQQGTAISSTNEFFDSDLVATAKFQTAGATGPTVTQDTTLGFGDSYCAKMDWSTDKASYARSTQIFTVADGSTIKALFAFRSSIAITGTNYYVSYRFTNGPTTPIYGLFTGLKADQWYIGELTWTNNTGASVAGLYFMFSLYPVTHDAWITYVDAVHVEIIPSTSSYNLATTYVYNPQAAASRTVGPGSYASLMNVDELRLPIGPLAVASANALALPKGSVFNISGAVAITSITAATSIAGRVVILYFASNPVVTDGNNLKLAGNFNSSADDMMMLWCDGTNWYELCRSAN